MAAISPEVRTALDAAVADFRKGGMSIGKVVKRLPIDDRELAFLIATTEITRVFAAGGPAAGAALKEQWPDERVVKTWATCNDDRTCPICKPLHGAVVDCDE